MLKVHYTTKDGDHKTLVCDTLTMLEGGADYFVDVHHDVTYDIAQLGWVEAITDDDDNDEHWYYYEFFLDKLTGANTGHRYKFKANSVARAIEKGKRLYESGKNLPEKLFESGIYYGRPDVNLMGESDEGIEFLTRFALNW